MPPRHAYWTILVDDQPTAFRAHDAEELLPTLNRLKEKNASVTLKWFERGQLFDSRDAARDAGLGQGERRWEGPRPEREGDGDRAAGRDRQRARGPRGEARATDEAPRDKNWRPGGEHRDPRQKYRDAKKAKWQRFKQQIRGRHDRRQDGATSEGERYSPPHGDPLRDQTRARSGRGWDEDRGGAPSRPHGDKLRPRPQTSNWRDRDTRDVRRNEDDRQRRDTRGRDQRYTGGGPRRDNDRPARDTRERDTRDTRRDDGRYTRDTRRPGDDRPARDTQRRDDNRRSNDRRDRPREDHGAKPWNARPAAGPRRDARGPAGGSSSGHRPWGSRPPGDRTTRGSSDGANTGRASWCDKRAPRGERKPWSGSARPSGGSSNRKPAGGRPSWGGAGQGDDRRRRRRDEDE